MGKIKFAELDVDANQTKAAEYGVMSIPTLIIFNKGKVVRTLGGLQDEDSLADALDKI
jgi:thioredoxin 1